MKKFRLTTVQFAIIGLILFGLLGTAIAVFSNKTLYLCLLLVTLAVLVALFIFQKKTYEMDELELIHAVNKETDEGLLQLLEQMPVGVVKLQKNSQKVEWFNPYAELMFAKDDGEIDQRKLTEIMAAGLDDDRTYAEFADKRYTVHYDSKQGMFYFFDISSEYDANFSLIESRPVIGIISVDNYDDLEDTLADSQLSQVNSFLAQFVSEFADQHEIFYRRGTMDRFYMFTNYAVLDQLMKEKFSLIDKFRSEAKELDLPLTLSIGLAFGDGNHKQIGQLALQNLNMAEVRGGDQVVVKENDDSKQPIFFGGGTASSIKRTRTRTRAMMTAVSDKLKTVDAVFVIGHRNMDMDALGSAVGMQHFAQNIMNNAYTVYDETDMYLDIERAVTRLKDEYCGNLITVSEAMKKVTNRSVLIMVDHSKTGLTLSKEFYDKFSQVIVVDHHRRDTDFPSNAVLTYIESGASSASELVTELIQFQNDKHHKLNKLQASLLMSGIMLDTKNFSTRVTSRTFDVASYLRSCGSDTGIINQIAGMNFNEYRQINELILNGRKVSDKIVIICGKSEKTYDNVVPSKAADTVLGMAGIEAVFVVTANQKGYVAISARSKQQVNVQRIMEEMGGGGHFNLAAAQVYDREQSDVVAELEHRIQIELVEG